jgi:hypothetical protein
MFGLFTRERAPSTMRREDGVTSRVSKRAVFVMVNGQFMTRASFGPLKMPMVVKPDMQDSVLSHEAFNRLGLAEYLQGFEPNHTIPGIGPATRLPLPFLNIDDLTVNDADICIPQRDCGQNILGRSVLDRLSLTNHGNYIEARAR